MKEIFVADTYPRLGRFLGWIVDGCLAAILFLVPLVVSSWSVDPVDAPKQIVLVSLSLIALVAWFGQALCQQRLVIGRSWSHLVIIVSLIGYGVASYLSLDRYVSFVGRAGQMQWAFGTVCALAIVYFLLSTTATSLKKLYSFLSVVLASSALVGIASLVQFFGIHPFGFLGAFTSAPGFTFIGTINAMATYQALALVLSVGIIIYGQRAPLATKIASWIALVTSLACVIAVNYWPVWIALIFGLLILILSPLLRRESIKNPLQLVIPACLIFVSIGLLIFPTPFKLNLSSEVSPSFQASFDIAQQELLTHPFFGSGPGTWIFDYSKYRSIAVNTSPYWTVRFEQGISTALTAIATMGLIGFTLWFVSLLSLLFSAGVRIAKHEVNDEWNAGLILFAALVSLSILLCLTNATLSMFVLSAALLGCIVALMEKRQIVWDTRRSVGRAAVLSLTFLVTFVGSISLFWLVGQRAVAEAQASKAITGYTLNRPLPEVIGPLEVSIRLNPWSDLAPRNIAQAYMLKAAQILNLPAGADRDKQVNDMIALALSASSRAIQLSPSNVENWASSAFILQALASTSQGADDQALKMFAEALTREPNNPVFYTEIGKIHLLRADTKQQLIQSKDAQVKKDAQAQMATELDQAAQSLNQAIQAKPDYAAAHYAMALVYEREGRGKDAIQRLEQVLSIEPKNIGVGFELAILYYRDGQKDRSLNLFEQIVGLQPTYANARWYLASLYEENGGYDDAIAQLKAIQTANSQDANAVTERIDQLIQDRAKAKAPKVQPLPEPITEVIGGTKK